VRSASVSTHDPVLCLQYAFLLGALLSRELFRMRGEKPIPDKLREESDVEVDDYVSDRLFGSTTPKRGN
jgi:hypothetical protein